MMRAIGFLSGVGLTVAAFLLVLDTRESQRPEPSSEGTGDTTAEQLSVVAAAIAEHVDVVQAEKDSDQPVAQEPESAAAGGDPHSSFEHSGLDREPHLGVPAEAQAGASDPEHSGAAGTYLFWSPFRSAWSAQGFAGRLSSATQVPVEVVDAGPGKYRVAFSYQDETERLARIRRIETITGLKLE